MRIIWICIFLFFLCSDKLCSSITVRVSIFDSHSLPALVVSSENGKYILTDGQTELLSVGENDLIYISLKGDELYASNGKEFNGSFQKIHLVSSRDEDSFGIRPVHPVSEVVHYYGNLEIGISYGRISLINVVDENLYLSGVVEAESGRNAGMMFYKAQSVICRTFLYGNHGRHADEGFHLCDGVHCQVYKGVMTGSGRIREAVNATSEQVITDGRGDLITAAFHSNCGGQTANSEDVWLVQRSYLRSVTDPFCRERPGAGWRITADAGRWTDYLAGMGALTGSGINPVVQNERSRYYHAGGLSIPYTKIRADWNLRSAWFNIGVSDDGNHVIFSGRGHGHGAGFCQEGAMEMAEKGYDYIEILKFYYTNITIESSYTFFR